MDRKAFARLVDKYRQRYITAGIKAEDDQEMEGRFEVRERGDRHEARLTGVMDEWFGFDVEAMIQALDRANPTALDLVISSPGGQLTAGLTLYDYLRNRMGSGMELTARVEGIAASAATLPLVAADVRTASESGQVMVHAAAGGLIAYGAKKDLEAAFRRTMAAFDAAESSMLSAYNSRVEGFDDQWVKDGEDHFFMGQAAVDAGLLTGLAGAEDEEEDEEPSLEAMAIAASLIRGGLTRGQRAG